MLKCVVAMPFVIASLAAMSACAQLTAGKAVPEPAAITGKGYRLVFNDEFDGKAGQAANSKLWSSWYPGRPRKAAFNVEDACRLDGKGNLVIEIRRGRDRIETGGVWTSGKFEATHGYFECRCQLTAGGGYWPAFWLMPRTISQSAPDAGVEIDVMEYLADHKRDLALHTLHWGGYDKEHHKKITKETKVPGLSAGFHTFAVRWDTDGYVFYTDGVETGRFDKDKAPVSNVPEHIILSCEANTWAGDIKKAKLPDYFKVDWVRVWQTPAQIEADRKRNKK